MRNRTSSGLARKRIAVIKALTQTVFPEPVAPAISRCGISARSATKDWLQNNAKILEEALHDFGIEAKVTEVEMGPVITRYEIEPAPGVKVQRITTLADDLALVMKAPSVRIIAPIPGKARVGIETHSATPARN